MEGLIDQASQFVSAHGMWAGPVVGILCFGESLAIVGLFVPATAVMLAIGGLIGADALDAWPIFIWAVAGSILGDWVSYGLGNRIGPRIYRRWPLNRHRPAVARTRLFFRKFGFAAVFMGRFLGPIRATVPLVAGVLAMPGRPFQIANIASATLWVPLMFAPGYLAAGTFGSQWSIDEGHLMLGALLLAGCPLTATFLGSRLQGRARKRGRARARLEGGNAPCRCPQDG
ncbi:DedA family protein [Novosphingobium aerophilum]|uniref:DedA family protein n=1 Tax=Novosphingobium aerophilum TaxID=2839843 RepID=UPI003FD56154